MTTLTTTDICKLTATIVGGGFKRAASKDEAAKRFTKVATEAGIDAAAILAATDYAAALAALEAARAPKAAPVEAASKSRRATLDLLEAVAPAPEKVKPIRAKKVRAPKPEGSSTRTRVADEAVIAEVVANPKKEGSRAYARFALYRAGQTVGQFVAACVAAGFAEREARADISWDRRHDFIKLAA